MDEEQNAFQDQNIQPGQNTRAQESAGMENRSSLAIFVSGLIIVALIMSAGFYALRFIKKSENTPTLNALKTSPAPVPPVTIPEVKIPTPEVAEESQKNGVIVHGAAKDPGVAVEEFYNWYLEYPGDPIADGAYKTHNIISEDLIKKIEISEKETDPFLCGMERSSGIEVEPAKTSDDSSSVIINVKSNGMVTPVKANLKLNGNWKIINIVCLSENGERGVLENMKQETGLDYTTVIDTVFYWNVPDYKGRMAISIKGKGFSTANASIDPLVIKNFFIKNGFKEDPANISGYKKDDIVCVDSSKTDAGNKFNVKVDCGKFAPKF